MEIILGILSYFIISCTIVIILGIIVGDCEFAISVGLIWPIAVPLLIGLAIIAIVGVLVYKIAEFFIKNKKH